MIVNEICEENNFSNVQSSFIQEYKKSFTNTLLKLKEIKFMNKKQMIFYNEVKYFNPFLMTPSFPSFTSSEFLDIEKKDYLLYTISIQNDSMIIEDEIDTTIDDSSITIVDDNEILSNESENEEKNANFNSNSVLSDSLDDILSISFDNLSTFSNVSEINLD
ncbi:hypothetical protein WA158_005204 [Blastocystis sp. Blastoise]